MSGTPVSAMPVVTKLSNVEMGDDDERSWTSRECIKPMTAAAGEMSAADISA